MAALDPKPGQRVLDVGCGTGQTVIQLAEAVGPAGEVVGIDIAPLLLEIARERAAPHPNVSFIEGDAQTSRLQAESFDAIFSRFGVMAFADPVEAFGNLHRAMKPDGRLAFVCWRSLTENELDLLPLRAAGLEGSVDMTPFAFEDPARVRSVLRAAGFDEIAIEPHEQNVGSGGLDAMLSVVMTVGALGKILREGPSLRADAEEPVRRALAACEGSDGVTLKAATWIVTARASSRGRSAARQRPNSRSAPGAVMRAS